MTRAMSLVLSIEAALLRAQLPTLVLRPGQALVARVAERHGAHGLLTIAGVPLSARLPAAVAAGDRLALVVAEVGAERVVLRLADPAAGLPASPVVLATGLRERLERRARERGEGGGERRRGSEEEDAPPGDDADREAPG
jgi:hypothetical protein